MTANYEIKDKNTWSRILHGWLGNQNQNAISRAMKKPEWNSDTIKVELNQFINANEKTVRRWFANIGKDRDYLTSFIGVVRRSLDEVHRIYKQCNSGAAVEDASNWHPAFPSIVLFNAPCISPSIKWIDIQKSKTFNDFSSFVKHIEKFPKNHPQKITIVGPQGSGKHSLIKYLQKNHESAMQNLEFERIENLSSFKGKDFVVYMEPWTENHLKELIKTLQSMGLLDDTKVQRCDQFAKSVTNPRFSVSNLWPNILIDLLGYIISGDLNPDMSAKKLRLHLVEKIWERAKFYNDKLSALPTDMFLNFWSELLLKKIHSPWEKIPYSTAIEIMEKSIHSFQNIHIDYEKFNEIIKALEQSTKKITPSTLIDYLKSEQKNHINLSGLQMINEFHKARLIHKDEDKIWATDPAIALLAGLQGLEKRETFQFFSSLEDNTLLMENFDDIIRELAISKLNTQVILTWLEGLEAIHWIAPEINRAYIILVELRSLDIPKDLSKEKFIKAWSTTVWCMYHDIGGADLLYSLKYKNLFQAILNNISEKFIKILPVFTQTEFDSLECLEDWVDPVVIKITTYFNQRTMYFDQIREKNKNNFQMLSNIFSSCSPLLDSPNWEQQKILQEIAPFQFLNIDSSFFGSIKLPCFSLKEIICNPSIEAEKADLNLLVNSVTKNPFEFDSINTKSTQPIKLIDRIYMQAINGHKFSQNLILGPEWTELLELYDNNPYTIDKCIDYMCIAWRNVWHYNSKDPSFFVTIYYEIIKNTKNDPLAILRLIAILSSTLTETAFMFKKNKKLNQNQWSDIENIIQKILINFQKPDIDLFFYILSQKLACHSKKHLSSYILLPIETSFNLASMFNNQEFLIAVANLSCEIIIFLEKDIEVAKADSTEKINCCPLDSKSLAIWKNIDLLSHQSACVLMEKFGYRDSLEKRFQRKTTFFISDFSQIIPDSWGFSLDKFDLIDHKMEPVSLQKADAVKHGYQSSIKALIELVKNGCSQFWHPFLQHLCPNISDDPEYSQTRDIINQWTREYYRNTPSFRGRFWKALQDHNIPFTLQIAGITLQQEGRPPWGHQELDKLSNKARIVLAEHYFKWDPSEAVYTDIYESACEAENITDFKLFWQLVIWSKTQEFSHSTHEKIIQQINQWLSKTASKSTFEEKYLEKYLNFPLRQEHFFCMFTLWAAVLSIKSSKYNQLLQEGLNACWMKYLNGYNFNFNLYSDFKNLFDMGDQPIDVEKLLFKAVKILKQDLIFKEIGLPISENDIDIEISAIAINFIDEWVDFWLANGKNGNLIKILLNHNYKNPILLNKLIGALHTKEQQMLLQWAAQKVEDVEDISEFSSISYLLINNQDLLFRIAERLMEKFPKEQWTLINIVFNSQPSNSMDIVRWARKLFMKNH